MHQTFRLQIDFSPKKYKMHQEIPKNWIFFFRHIIHSISSFTKLTVYKILSSVQRTGWATPLQIHTLHGTQNSLAVSLLIMSLQICRKILPMNRFDKTTIWPLFYLRFQIRIVLLLSLCIIDKTITR